MVVVLSVKMIITSLNKRGKDMQSLSICKFFRHLFAKSKLRNSFRIFPHTFIDRRNKILKHLSESSHYVKENRQSAEKCIQMLILRADFCIFAIENDAEKC
jgi:hypothetical protein